MKTTTLQAVKAYDTLKSLKVSDLSEEAMYALWHDIKTLRPIAEEYGKQRDEVLATLHDSSFDEMQKRLQVAKEREEKTNKGEYTMTEADIKDVQEINQWYATFNGKADKYFTEMGAKEVDIDIKPIADAELLKALRACGKSFADMEELGWLTE